MTILKNRMHGIMAELELAARETDPESTEGQAIDALLQTALDCCASVIRYITPPKCGMCGQPVAAVSCGPTHALRKAEEAAKNDTR